MCSHTKILQVWLSQTDFCVCHTTVCTDMMFAVVTISFYFVCTLFVIIISSIEYYTFFICCVYSLIDHAKFYIDFYPFEQNPSPRTATRIIAPQKQRTPSSQMQRTPSSQMQRTPTSWWKCVLVRTLIPELSSSRSFE